MTIVFAGAEREAFAANTGPVTESTTGGFFNSTYCRSSLLASGATCALDTPALGALTTAYIRFDFHPNSFLSNSGRVFARGYNSSGLEVFRLTGNTSSQFQMQYWNGSWTNIGAAVSNANALKTIELKIVCGGSGSAELFVDDASVASGSASMTLVTNIDKVQLVDNIGGGSTIFYSRLTVGTAAMLTWQLFNCPATGVGGDTDGTGTYTDINEQTLSDVTLCSLTTAGEHKSFKSAARSIGAGLVKGVTVTARAARGASGPSKIKFYLKISGTRYYSGDIPLTTGLTGYQYTWETNPATGAIWTAAAAGDANLEWGWEAVT